MAMIDSAALAALNAASQGFVLYSDISDRLGAASEDIAGGLDEEHVEALRPGSCSFCVPMAPSSAST